MVQQSLLISIQEASKLIATATVGEVKKFIREKIEEKKKAIRKPECQACGDRILAELEILQMVMAEIYDIGRRKDLAKKYKATYNEKT
jgi:hypothetical protein